MVMKTLFLTSEGTGRIPPRWHIDSFALAVPSLRRCDSSGIQFSNLLLSEWSPFYRVAALIIKESR
jgi:hypothetical protein